MCCLLNTDFRAWAFDVDTRLSPSCRLANCAPVKGLGAEWGTLVLLHAQWGCVQDWGLLALWGDPALRSSWCCWRTGLEGEEKEGVGKGGRKEQEMERWEEGLVVYINYTYVHKAAAECTRLPSHSRFTKLSSPAMQSMILLSSCSLRRFVNCQRFSMWRISALIMNNTQHDIK